MSKKLQVFISSTFTDLRDERQAAVAGVLLAGHIPAGMELFTAGDQEQLEVIKRWIRESDVYMLILGARYGSIEQNTGKSYTELEYDYASELKKPSFAVFMNGESYVSRLKSIDDGGGAQHDAFRAKVMSRMSSPFTSIAEMKLGIVTALRDIEERPGLVGWIQTSQMPDVQPILAEIGELRQERDDLRAELAKRPTMAVAGKRLAGLDEPVKLDLQYRNARLVLQEAGAATATWAEIFALIAPELHEFPNDDRVNGLLAKFLYSRVGCIPNDYRDLKIESYSWGTVRTQFEALGLVTFKYLQAVSKSMHLYWYATEAGKQMGAQLRAVYSAKP